MDTVTTALSQQEGSLENLVCPIILAIVIGKLMLMWSNYDMEKGNTYRRNESL